MRVKAFTQSFAQICRFLAMLSINYLLKRDEFVRAHGRIAILRVIVTLEIGGIAQICPSSNGRAAGTQMEIASLQVLPGFAFERAPNIFGVGD